MNSIHRQTQWPRSLIGILLGIYLPTGAMTAKTLVEATSEVVQLTVPVMLLQADGSTFSEERLKSWEDEVFATWNHPVDDETFVFCGRKVEIRANFQNYADDYREWNLIRVEERKKSKTQVLDDPLAENGTGVWTIEPDYREFAHELGHFLGLHDEYHIEIQPDGSELAVPNSMEAARSLMGSHDGDILRRNVRDVLESHDLNDCGLRVKIDETMVTGVTPELEHYFWRLDSDLEVHLFNMGNGRYSASTVEGKATRHWLPGDGCEVVQGTVPQTVTLVRAEGTREGEEVSLQIEVGIRDRESFDLQVSCDGGAFGGPVPAMGLTSQFHIDGRLRDGRLNSAEREEYDVLTLERQYAVEMLPDDP